MNIYELPEPLLQMILHYIFNSSPRIATIQETLDLTTALQKLEKIEEKPKCQD